MNIIAYRLPGETEPNIYKAESSISHPRGISFYISPFDPSKEGVYYPLSTRTGSIPETCIKNNFIGSNFQEKSHDEYISYIEKIIASLNGDINKKIVASRRLTFSLGRNVNEIFQSLCKAYPNAFVFFISTAEFGTWIGASPELLLERRAGVLSTMALAGTRMAEKAPKTNGTPKDWDEKNLKEQQIVTDHIVTLFKRFGIDYTIGERTTKKAGRIEHLMTPVMGRPPEDFNLKAFLHDFSPTPALAGYPKAESLKVISENEGDRALYGGFCGPVYPDGDFRFNVILRCGFISHLPSPAITLFAGGGVTTFSDPETEYIETLNKMETLKFFI